MPFVAAVCLKCGSALAVDSKDAVVCAYCGTPYVAEKASGPVPVDFIETRLQNAEIFLTRHKDYAKAEALYKAIVEDAPGDYRTWWGVVRACTGDLSADAVSRHGCGDAAKYAAGAFNVAPMEERVLLRKQWADVSGSLECRKNELQTEINMLKKRNASLSIILMHLTKPVHSVFGAIAVLTLFLVIALYLSNLVDIGFITNMLSVLFLVGYAMLFFMVVMGTRIMKKEHTNKTKEIQNSLPEEERKLFDAKDIDALCELQKQNEAKIQKLERELRAYD